VTAEPPGKNASPFAVHNVRLFIAFRVFFNARFYYPVFTILFLDFGLTLDQFALLNAVWAATIVLLEVPSGALADIIGRRNLLIVTGVLMVVEIGLLCIVPQGRNDLLFFAFLINRILSGAAEAAASGADEAIAYDSLKARGRADDWPLVLERLVRFQSAAYLFAMSIGAAVYDPALMQKVVQWLGWDLRLTQATTLRFPLFLTLGMALLTLVTTLRLREPGPSAGTRSRSTVSIAGVFRMTLGGGKWILQTPFVLVLIIAGLLFDNCIRMLITLNSRYYRAILIPEGAFGLIGSAFAVLGFFIPLLARRMVVRYSPLRNLMIMVATTLTGLWGMTYFWPVFGIIPVVLLMTVMYFNNFFMSHYLNRMSSSEQRATILSFKGLSFNLAYGLIGICYSLLLAVLRGRLRLADPGLEAAAVENTVFKASIGYFPWYFLITMTALMVFASWRLTGSPEIRHPIE
jgi:MFS family permease